MHLVGYLYEDCHDARSLEHKLPETSLKHVTFFCSCCYRLSEMGRLFLTVVTEMGHVAFILA